MATIYLRSTDGNDADDGSTWALAKATLAAAITAAGSGGTVYVSQVHAETQATAMTLSIPGTPSGMVRVLCANDSSQPPTALATTATVSTTGANAITMSGSTNGTGAVYFYGLTFSAGSGANVTSLNVGGTNNLNAILENCKLILGGTTASNRISIGATSRPGDIVLINTTMKFTDIGQAIDARQRITWMNTPAAIDLSGSIPTTLFPCITGVNVMVLIKNVDLSAIATGRYLVAPISTGEFGGIRFVNCKIGASATLLNTGGSPINWRSSQYSMENCDSSDTNYRMEHYKYQGSIKSETSKIRTGGASDGTTPISWNMTSLAGASFVSPLDSPPIAIWNDTAGVAKTVTIEIAQGSSAAALNNDEVWLEVEYLGTSGFPLGVTASSRKIDIFSAAAAQPASSAAWPNLTTPTKQYLTVTFTPVSKGAFQARVMLAKPSVTVYVDPLLTVS